MYVSLQRKRDTFNAGSHQIQSHVGIPSCTVWEHVDRVDIAFLAVRSNKSHGISFQKVLLPIDHSDSVMRVVDISVEQFVFASFT
jgi:hypothetical protein